MPFPFRVHPRPPVLSLDFVSTMLTTILKELKRMSAILDTLTQEVAAEGTVVQSAVTLLNGLSQQLKDALASGDPAAIQKVIDAVDAQKQQLADAVAANTPVTPPATEPGNVTSV